MPPRRRSALSRPKRRSALATWVPVVAAVATAAAVGTAYAHHRTRFDNRVDALRESFGPFDRLYISYKNPDAVVPYRVFVDVSQSEARRHAADSGEDDLIKAERALQADLQLVTRYRDDLADFRGNPFNLPAEDPSKLPANYSISAGTVSQIYDANDDSDVNKSRAALNKLFRDVLIPHDYQIALHKALLLYSFRHPPTIPLLDKIQHRYFRLFPTNTSTSTHAGLDNAQKKVCEWIFSPQGKLQKVSRLRWAEDICDGSANRNHYSDIGFNISPFVYRRKPGSQKGPVIKILRSPP
jgi:hypothetical protein